MTKKLLLLFLLLGFISRSQTISIVGTGVNGWPPDNVPEITLSTTDNITYTIPNLAVSNGFVKFRQDYAWANNWGGTTFPSGQGILDGSNIPTVAGTYDVTFNRANGTYTFIGTAAFPSIGIWGTAVNSQLGFGAPDVDMTTNDGITYTLSGFYFSSGSAYFRQDNATNFVWGSVAFPIGTAVLNGPTIQVSGGEWFVNFNKNTGEYSFTYPSVGILGTALNGFAVADTDLSTTDGFNYTISGLALTDGEVKFRKDNLWTANWGNTAFPIGTGTQDGPNIPVTAGTYNISFERTSGNYVFTNTLSGINNALNQLKIYPNPADSHWNILHSTLIDKVQLFDGNGKELQTLSPNNSSIILSGHNLSSGVYFLKVTSGSDFCIQKIIKN
ncbi:MAG: T9SS type A sorting domain-containing protein [Flavobacterium sp.]|nr:T9SS type A sorting domain-containing protein [Flavobacterium sp.]